MTNEELAAARLEMSIDCTRKALEGAKTPSIRAELQEQLRHLIGRRSPWMIAKLEKERGVT